MNHLKTKRDLHFVWNWERNTYSFALSISIYISVHSESYKIGLELANLMTQDSIIFLERINSNIRTTLLLIRCKKIRQSKIICVS